MCAACLEIHRHCLCRVYLDFLEEKFSLFVVGVGKQNGKVSMNWEAGARKILS